MHCFIYIVNQIAHKNRNKRKKAREEQINKKYNTEKMAHNIN